MNKNVLILWGVFMSLTGCSFFNNTTIVKIPISLHQAGSVVEADFEIPQDDRVTLLLIFSVSDQLGDRSRLLNFLGGLGRTGTPFPLKVKIVSYVDAKELVVLDKIYITKGTSGIGETELDRRIDELSVKSGRYRIRLETIEDFPLLANTKVQFGLYYIRAPIM